MEVFGRFTKVRSGGMEISRVVPTNTIAEDLKDFHLYPGETVQIRHSKKGKTYVCIISKGNFSHWYMLDRANTLSAYLKALHTSEPSEEFEA